MNRVQIYKISHDSLVYIHSDSMQKQIVTKPLTCNPVGKNTTKSEHVFFEKYPHYFHLRNLNSTYPTLTHPKALQLYDLVRVFKD